MKDGFGKLINYCRNYIPFIAIALLCAIGGTILTLSGPERLSEMTDIITAGIMTSVDLSEIRRVGITLAIIYGSSFVLSYIQGFIMATVTQRISYNMRKDISQKINRLPLKYFDQSSYGDVLSRVTNDVDMIGQTLNQSIGTLVTAITLFFGAIIMMLITNVTMALVAVASSLIGFVLMILIISRSQKYFTRQQKELGKINGHIEEIYAGLNVVRIYNAQDKEREKFKSINKELYNCAWKSQFLSGMMMPFMQFIGNFGYVAVCVTGAALAINGSISFGVIVAFMVYVRLFTQPLSQFAQAANSLQQAGAASSRVFEFLAEEELKKETQIQEQLLPEQVQGQVSFRNVSFGYSPDKTIIHDFSAEVKSGQKIAIVGPTGAGKTTLVNLLMRFYEVDEGEICIDGRPVSALTRENVHSLFCMVLQDTWLFEGTIMENVIYSKEGVSEEAVIQACKAVGIHHFIKTLPKGYHTILDDNTSLSAGQKQLLTIARAMVENAPMLILDEATSAVDTRTEIQIQRAMDQLMKGRTSFVIAHRLSTIKDADTILVMRDGDIVESGNHEELLEKGGFYADLYNSQFDKAS